MKPSQVATALRDLADRFEAIGVDDSGKLSAGIQLNIHHVETREQLASLLPLVAKPLLNASVPCIYSRDYDSPSVTLFHVAGLLGGERREIFVDSQAGLDALVAEAVAVDHAEEVAL